MDISKPDDQRVLHAIYADDTVILATSRNAELAVKLAQVHLTKISNFFDAEGHTINSRKTQATVFAWQQHGPLLKNKIRATYIDLIVPSLLIKELTKGVTMDSCLLTIR